MIISSFVFAYSFDLSLIYYTYYLRFKIQLRIKNIAVRMAIKFLLLQISTESEQKVHTPQLANTHLSC